MNSDDQEKLDGDFDEAIITRLARLRTMPVDTSRLDKALRSRIPQPQTKPRTFWLRPLHAVAASFVLLAALAAVLVLNASSGPALADATQMAQVHEDMVSGRIPVMQVSSIADANRMLAWQAPGTPALPQVPQEHVMACCMKSVHNKKMACVLLKDKDVPVTLAVANAAELKLPAAPMQERNGTTYRVQSVGKLSMVMTERNGKWLCLIGQLPAERLMDLATEVRF